MAEELNPREKLQCTGRLSKLFQTSSYHSPWHVNLIILGPYTWAVSELQEGSDQQELLARKTLGGLGLMSPKV